MYVYTNLHRTSAEGDSTTLLAGAASKSQERIREIAKANYNTSVNGLSGVRVVFCSARPSHILIDGLLQNEDCGQMSAWYIFSALGFYPVNPVSTEYVVGTYVASPVHEIQSPNV